MSEKETGVTPEEATKTFETEAPADPFVLEDDIVATKPEGIEFEVIPQGVHIAICTAVIDLGTHAFNFKGKDKQSKKVRIVFETPNERTVFEEEKGEQPFHVAVEYGLSLFESSKLRKALESWRGKAFSEEELAGFSLKNILGKACQIQIIHKPSSDGSRVYPEIATIMALPKGSVVPPAESELTFITPKKWFTPEFDALPEFVQNKIKDSLEYKQASQIGEADIPME